MHPKTGTASLHLTLLVTAGTETTQIQAKGPVTLLLSGRSLKELVTIFYLLCTYMGARLRVCVYIYIYMYRHIHTRAYVGT